MVIPHVGCDMRNARCESEILYVFYSTSEALHTVYFLRDDYPPFDPSAIGEDKELYMV